MKAVNNKIFLILLFFVPVLSLGFLPSKYSTEVIRNGEVLYLSNTVVVKLNQLPSINADGSVVLPSSLNDLSGLFGNFRARVLFPESYYDHSTSLGKIVLIEYDSKSDPVYVSSKIRSTSEVEWAEPKYVYELSFTPNDPNYGSQWNLSKIQAALAWDISTGDTNIVIGIIDTGVDWDHPDLSVNIWRNWEEISSNGIDDDQNGFIDDIRGWDFGGLSGTPDNDPMEDRPDHGTHVAGISSAVTNNNIGIASIGFKSRIMAVKTCRDDQRGPNGPYIIYGYEGIYYAGNNGAKVINCSWGGAGYSSLGQETIDYVTQNGALVVAAAGNSNSSSNHYPSSYNNVISVASTNSNDIKSSFSNYGNTVDVSAPGESIYSTWQNNTYTYLQGTSMASPLVAGLAALVWSKFPGYNAIQIGEQIRVNCDDIDGSNPSYKNKLGKGRINAYKSLNNINSVSVRLLDVQFTDEAPGGDNDGILEPGETVSIGIAFKNYLSPTSNLSVTLQSKNSYSTIVNGSFNAGAIGTLTEFNNYSSRFTFTISSSTPANTNLSFLLNYSDGSYTDYEWIGAIGNPTYATQAGNDISITITSKGTYGFNDYPNNLQGSGFQYLSGGNNLFEGALILGTSATKISDAARGSDGNTQNSDFSVVKPFVLSIPGQVADVEGTSVFNDNNAGGNKIGITAKLHTYSFAQSPNNNFIILKYTFLNNGSTPVSNLFAGLFFDWDMISSGSGDVVSYDASFNFGRVYHQGGSPDHHIGVALVSSQDFGFYAIKNDGGDGGFSIYDGFTDQEKWNSLSGGVAKPNAGPGDVSNVTSGGPYSIPVGDSITVAFVIAAASNETDLQNSIITARNKYQNIITGVENGKNENLPVHFELSQNYPNPFNPSTRISYSIPQNSLVSLKVYDVLGNEVANLVDAQQSAGRYEVTFDGSNLASGIYLYTIKAGDFTSTKKLVLMK